MYTFFDLLFSGQFQSFARHTAERLSRDDCLWFRQEDNGERMCSRVDETLSETQRKKVIQLYI